MLRDGVQSARSHQYCGQLGGCGGATIINSTQKVPARVMRRLEQPRHQCEYVERRDRNRFIARIE